MLPHRQTPAAGVLSSPQITWTVSAPDPESGRLSTAASSVLARGSNGRGRRAGMDVGAGVVGGSIVASHDLLGRAIGLHRQHKLSGYFCSLGSAAIRTRVSPPARISKVSRFVASPDPVSSTE